MSSEIRSGSPARMVAHAAASEAKGASTPDRAISRFGGRILTVAAADARSISAYKRALEVQTERANAAESREKMLLSSCSALSARVEELIALVNALNASYQQTMEALAAGQTALHEQVDAVKTELTSRLDAAEDAIDKRALKAHCHPFHFSSGGFEATGPEMPWPVKRRFS